MVFKVGVEGDTTRELGAVDIPAPPPLAASAEDTKRGEALHNRVCVGCCGIGAVATINADLRMMTAETHERFQDIVRGGVLSDKGMLSFAEAVSTQEAELIRQYVISEAQKARAAQWRVEGRASRPGLTDGTAQRARFCSGDGARAGDRSLQSATAQAAVTITMANQPK